MDRFKIPDDQPMEAKILSRQIEGAQKKVEEQNFVIRKNTLKYDDVLNRHRGRIYEQRRQVLDGEDLSEQIKLWIEEVVEDTVNVFTPGGVRARVGSRGAHPGDGPALPDRDHGERAARGSRPDLPRRADRGVPEDARDEYEAKEEEFGSELMRELERYIVLQVVDMRWREHLENMEVLREGVHLRQMAQKDPLVEYTAEGERMFTELGRIIRSEVVLHLFHAEIAPEQGEQQLQQAQTTNGNIHYEHETSAGAAAIAEAGGGAAVAAGVPSAAGVVSRTVQTSERDKIGRNDPCWCGSGKKFKKCHGA